MDFFYEEEIDEREEREPEEDFDFNEEEEVEEDEGEETLEELDVDERGHVRPRGRHRNSDEDFDPWAEEGYN